MPIRPPVLDDRTFDDLVEEALARIPAHTPEWRNPRLGDPGRTLIELFAWLTDTLLYRVNLIPERQRLAFLRLLGQPMRPASAARGLVSVFLTDANAPAPAQLPALAIVKGPVNFETRAELTVLPVTADAYTKRRLTDGEAQQLAGVVDGLQQVYKLDGAPVPYVTTPAFPGGALDPTGVDIGRDALDRCLWLALLAAKPDPAFINTVRAGLGPSPEGSPRVLNVGVAPAVAVPALFEEIGPRARVPHVWEISTGRETAGAPEYLALDVVPGGDGTQGLTQRGVVRLVLPNKQNIGALTNDVGADVNAGVGDRPPRLDDPDRAGRLVAWVRLRPTVKLTNLPLSWVGINCVEIDQRQTLTNRIVGTSDGSPDQEMQLPGRSVEPNTFVLQVEEPGRGFQTWIRVDDLSEAGRDAGAYVLDSEAGTVRFGTGAWGRIPGAGQRVKVGTMRSGGGTAGNFPAGTLTAVSTPGGVALRVEQSLPTEGGDEAETLAAAEQRIPARLRHNDRAVTADDFRRLADEAPGVRVGRVEVLPRFKPHQRRANVPGTVSVVVLPAQAEIRPPNPRPDRPFLETVHAHLDARRLIGTELYTIGCEYVPLAVGVAVTVRDGFGYDATLQAVRDGLRRFLWPLPPGGADGTGWPLGRAVRDRELEVAAALVPGVGGVAPVNLFERSAERWRLVARADGCGPTELKMEAWQLPELLAVVVVVGDESPDDPSGVPNPYGESNGAAVPVVPEVC